MEDVHSSDINGVTNQWILVEQFDREFGKVSPRYDQTAECK